MRCILAANSRPKARSQKSWSPGESARRANSFGVITSHTRASAVLDNDVGEGTMCDNGKVDPRPIKLAWVWEIHKNCDGLLHQRLQSFTAAQAMTLAAFTLLTIARFNATNMPDFRLDGVV